jgi:hypothetical protein
MRPRPTPAEVVVCWPRRSFSVSILTTNLDVQLIHKADGIPQVNNLDAFPVGRSFCDYSEGG